MHISEVSIYCIKRKSLIFVITIDRHIYMCSIKNNHYSDTESNYFARICSGQLLLSSFVWFSKCASWDTFDTADIIIINQLDMLLRRKWEMEMQDLNVIVFRCILTTARAESTYPRNLIAILLGNRRPGLKFMVLIIPVNTYCHTLHCVTVHINYSYSVYLNQSKSVLEYRINKSCQVRCPSNTVNQITM